MSSIVVGISEKIAIPTTIVYFFAKKHYLCKENNL